MNLVKRVHSKLVLLDVLDSTSEVMERFGRLLLPLLQRQHSRRASIREKVGINLELLSVVAQCCFVSKDVEIWSTLNEVEVEYGLL